MNTKFARITLAAATVVLCLSPLHAQVRVYQGTLPLPAYEEGVPNPNPAFDEYATTRFNYPYIVRDNLTSHRAVHNFRAVYLENEYLKCSVLPDLGGHIYTCIDKINNVPMFYANPSIKEAQIGMRGGWAAFGDEFNFPVSHSWTTISPVDFSFHKDNDGSASVTVSNIDRVYGMQWSVQIVLRPGTTLLEEHVTLNNRSDVRHRFYWWSNAGIQVWDDSRVCYPMRYSAAHGFADVDRWPVDSSGVDLSILRNQTAGNVSRFVHASREPYMGIWNPKTDAGVVHYAAYDELPGKKIWSWGADADAMDWRRALSDNNSAYMEVQGGLFRNQETFAFLNPRQTLHFTEYWMPIRQLGGLARATLAGAANLSRNGSTLTAALNVNRRYPHAEVLVLDGATVLRSAKEDLSPEKTWKQQVELPEPSRQYTLEVRDSSGKVLLSQTEGKYDWTPDSEVQTGPRPHAVVPPPARRSDDDWLQLGRNDELNGRLLVAAQDYADGLKAFPHSHSLAIAAGRLDVQLLHTADAIPLLESAQAEDTPNSEIAYYLGLAYDRAGQERHARIAYETAARLPEERAAAHVRLAEMDARQGDLAGAESMLLLALQDSPNDVRTGEELVAVLKAAGKQDAASAAAATWLGRFPNSYFLQEETGKPDLSHLAADPERIVSIASEYMRLGRYESALTVLSRAYPSVPEGEAEPGTVAPDHNALVGYYRAFCLRKLGRTADEEQARASAMSVRYIFPAGAESEAVLRSAVEQNAQDGTAQDLLGMLEFSVGLTRDAEVHWNRARMLNAKIYGVDANLGFAELNVDHNPQQALASFRQAIANDPSNDALYMGVDQASSLLGRPPAEFVEVMKQYPDKPNMRAKLVYELALHEAEAGDFADAEALFRNRFFPREEGGTNVRAVYIEVELARLRAEAHNGHCDVVSTGLAQLGKPKADMSFTQDGMEPLLAGARVQDEIANIDRACHRDADATAALQHTADSKNPEDLPWAYRAAEHLPGFDRAAWLTRLASAASGPSGGVETNSYAAYERGVLQQELGNKEAAPAEFHQVFFLPDQTLSYHLARVALQQSDSR